MIIVYVNRIGAKNADITFNTAGEGLWVIAEISFGLIVTCTFSLPKFIEAEGTKLLGVVSSLTRPFASLTSVTFLGSLTRSRKDRTASSEVTFDRITIIGNSENDISSTNRDQEME